MNILRESLISPASPNSKAKPKRSRSSHSKNNGFDDNQILSEPLLSSSDNNYDNIELGTMDSDDDNNSDNNKLNAQHIVRTRHIRQQSTPTTAHGGGSIVIVEKPILPQESLQAFAIRYRVPVSQLKRINNLQNDQDFYALKTCRVPVHRFGLLHESSSPSSIVVNLNDQSATNSSMSMTHLPQENHHAFLNAMDHDLASMRAKVQKLMEISTSTATTEPAATALIPDQPSTKTMTRSTRKPISDLNCDGADCGCKLWHIVGALILVALLIPLIYVYLFIKSPDDIAPHFP